jgi:hypothetical protein
MDETIPIPVMTTRLIIASPCRYVLVCWASAKSKPATPTADVF